MSLPSPSGLAETQHLLRRLITAPGGVREALAEDGVPERLELSGLLRGDGPVSRADRLDVYANAYFSRIREVLRDDYPALHAALGEDRFHHLVAGYLVAHAPGRFSLRYAGEHLPSFLTDHAFASALRDAFPWAADLAALEWAVVDAFDAPDHPPLAREDLARIPAGAWGGLRLALGPCARLLRARWPVNRLREARDAAKPLPDIARQDTAICVWRRDERVFHRAIDPLEAACLDLVSEGASFGAVCGRVALEVGEVDAPARALALLTRWIDNGLLSAAGRTPRLPA